MKLQSPIHFAVFIALGLAGSMAVAQCATGFTSYNAYCGNSNGCSSSTTYTVATGQGMYGVPFACGTTYCCSQGFPNCYALVGDCWFAKTDPGARQRLLELAKSEDLMVATCGGKYTPLSAALAEDAKPILRPGRTLVRLTGGGE